MAPSTEEIASHSNSTLAVWSFVIAVAAIVVMLMVRGWDHTFALFRIPLQEPISDLRVITGALVSTAGGFDPYVENPGDATGRAFNYPALWLFLFRILGRLGDPALILGAFQAVAFVALGLLLCRERRGLLVTFLALSPPFLLLLERGNNDGLTFLLVLAGLRSGSTMGGVFVGLATALKVYPAAAIIAGFGFPSRRLFARGVLLTSPLIALTALQTRQLAAATPIMPYASFGSLALAREFLTRRLWLGFQPIPDTPATLYLATFGILMLFLSAAVTVWLALRSLYRETYRRLAELDPTSERMFFGFLTLFLGIFCASSSFGYRIIFLFPVIWVFGQLAELKRNRQFAVLLIAGVLVLYAPFLPKGWLLFGPLVGLYALMIAPLALEAASQSFTCGQSATMPRWPTTSAASRDD